jgi:cell wall-associated NlpC family hydrolase
MSQGDDIVRVARTWIGTRYHHQGRLKADPPRHRGGVDCLGLLAGVAQELDLRDGKGVALATFDRTDYAHCVAGEPLRETLRGLLREKKAGELAPGDVVLFALDRAPQHLAIASRAASGEAGWHMVHAYATARGVVEHRLDDAWRARIVALFTLI